MMKDTALTTFETAFKTVLKHEGHISNDPDDPGGYTVYGISLRAAIKLGDMDGDGFDDLDLDRDGDVDIDDMRKIDIEVAKTVYREAYWRDIYDTLPPELAVKLFDLAVNMGHRQAHKNLQRAVRAASGVNLVNDGIIGDKTLSAIHSCYARTLIAALRSETAGFYRLLTVKNPTSKKYLKGWLNRAYA